MYVRRSSVFTGSPPWDLQTLLVKSTPVSRKQLGLHKPAFKMEDVHASSAHALGLIRSTVQRTSMNHMNRHSSRQIFPGSTSRHFSVWLLSFTPVSSRKLRPSGRRRFVNRIITPGLPWQKDSHRREHESVCHAHRRDSGMGMLWSSTLTAATKDMPTQTRAWHAAPIACNRCGTAERGCCLQQAGARALETRLFREDLKSGDFSYGRRSPTRLGWHWQLACQCLQGRTSRVFRPLPA